MSYEVNLLENSPTWQKMAELGIYMLMHDELIPEIYSQRGMEWIYEDPEQRAARIRPEDSSKPDSAIMFDMDDFKRINDTFSHAGGDEALKRVAKGVTEQIKELTRKGDLLARLHGDEFVLVLFGATQDEALAVSDKLVGHIRRVGQSEGGVGETISMGVAEIPQHNLIEGIRRADLALYEAKNKGRNQAAGYNPSLERPEQLTLF